MSTNQADLDAGRAFWAAHLHSGLSYDLTPVNVDEFTALGKVACASCRIEQTLAMPEFAAFRLHGKEHVCTSCAASFTTEHVAVRRFLAKAEDTQRIGTIAGTLFHPKPLLFASNDRADAQAL